MPSVFFDAWFDDEARRQHLYQGNLFAFSPRPSTRALIGTSPTIIAVEELRSSSTTLCSAYFDIAK